MVLNCLLFNCLLQNVCLPAFVVCKGPGYKCILPIIKKYLQTKNIPDPDLLIRTGDTNRLSNFLLWQLSYSEIFFIKKYWPEFTEEDYIKILNKYKKIKRSFGNI